MTTDIKFNQNIKALFLKTKSTTLFICLAFHWQIIEGKEYQSYEWDENEEMSKAHFA